MSSALDPSLEIGVSLGRNDRMDNGVRLAASVGAVLPIALIVEAPAGRRAIDQPVRRARASVG
jgi:hypothetical protein